MEHSYLWQRTRLSIFLSTNIGGKLTSQSTEWLAEKAQRHHV